MLGSMCPHSNELRRYVAGSLDPEQSVRLESHLRQCAECTRAIESLGRPETDDERTADTGASLEDTRPVVRHSRPSQEVTHNREPDDELLLDAIPPLVDGCTAPSIETAGLGERLLVAPPEAGPASLPVDTPLGPYRVVARIAEGGMGTVYEAVHTKLGKPVALKILTARLMLDESAVRRFEREMKAVGRLEHPNVVSATDAGEAEGVHYLAMELVQGLDLSRLVKKLGPLPVADACELIRQAALALHYVHQQGLVHRDVKPSNLMLTNKGQVKLLDLGLALLADPHEADLSIIHQVLGTLDYIAPEQADDSHQVDCRADVYSLGCTLYGLLCGKAPFADGRNSSAYKKIVAHRELPPPSLRRRRTDVPEEVVDLIQRMLAKAPNDRPQTADEVATTLGPAAAGADLAGLAARAESATAHWPTRQATLQTTDAPPRPSSGDDATESAAKEEPRRGRRRPTVLVALAAAAIVLLMGIVVIIRNKRGDEVARVKLPPGGSVTIDQDVEHAGPEAPPRRDPLTTTTPPALGTWDLGPSENVLAGLIPRPAKLPGVGRWQVEPVAPRGSVYGLAWSPDDQWLAVGSIDHHVRVYEAATGRLVRLFLGCQGGAIPGLAWSPDGRWLASAGGFGDQTVRLWSVEDGKPGPVIKPRGGALAMAWSPDGRRIVVGGSGTVCVYDPFSEKLIYSCRQQEDRAYCVAWSPDGRWIASLGDENVYLWNASDGKPGPVFEAGSDFGGHFTHAVAFSPDGQWLAAPGEGRNIRLWSLDDGHPGPVLQGHGKAIKSIAWRHDGKRLASGGRDATIRIWDPNTGETIHVLEHTWWVNSVAWSPDGEQLASGSRDGSVRIWDAEGGELVREIGARSWPMTLHNAFVWIDCSPDGRLLATAGADHTVRFWDAATGRQDERVLRGHEDAVCGLAFSPDGRRIATWAHDKTVRVWTVEHGRQEASLDEQASGLPGWSPDGRRLAIPANKVVQIYDAIEQKTVGVLGSPSSVGKVAWSPDGRRIAFACGDDVVRIWSLEGDAPVRPLKGHTGVIRWLQWGSQGRVLRAAAATSDGIVIHAWDTDSDREISKERVSLPSESGQSVTAVAWSADGRMFAAGRQNGKIMLHDARDGTALLPLSGHDIDVCSLAWSPDGSQLVSIADDWTLRNWDPNTGQPRWLATLLTSGQVAVFTPAGEWLNRGSETEDELIYVVEQDDGAQEVLTPADFHRRIGAEADRLTETTRKPTPTGNWDPGPAHDILAGLIHRPAELPGVGRWQVETVFSRSQMGRIAWSHDGRWLACNGSSEPRIRLYALQEGRLRLTRVIPVAANHYWLAWSPTRNSLAIGSLWGAAARHFALWDVDQNRPVALKDLGSFESFGGWTPDGRWLTLVGKDTVKLVSPDRPGQVLQTLPLESGAQVKKVAWSPDGQWLAAACGSAVQLWRSSGEQGPVLEGHAGEVLRLAWSPDSQRLCAGSSQGALRIWTVAEKTFHELVGHQEAIKWLQFSPDGSRLAAFDKGLTLTLWDWHHHKQLLHLESSEELESMLDCAAWSPDGRWLSTGDYGSRICLWRAEDGNPGPVLSNPPSVPDGHGSTVTALAWHPDGRTIATASWNSSMHLWSIETGEPIQAFPQRLDRGTAVAWSTDGKRLAVGTCDRAIRLWNADSGLPEGILGRHEGSVRAVAWQPHRQRLASIGADSRLRLWDADSGRQEADVEIDADLLAMAWSPDGQCLATGDDRGLVRVHDGEDGTVVRSLNTQSATTFGLDWSPNGMLIATVSNAKVTVCDAVTGAQALTFKGDDIMKAIAWSPDGKQLATTSHKSLRLWDARSGEPGPVFSGWSGSVRWSREGGLLADRSGRSIRVIDVSTEQPVRILDGHAYGIASIAFDPTARRIASAAGDHLLHVWDVDQARPLWTAVFLSHDRVAVFSAAGELLHADPGAEDELIYLVEKEDEETGALECLSADDFHARIDGKPN